MFDFKNALGVPNWHDASAYPAADTTTPAQWRWQFLRRRPDYREAWLEHYDECQLRFDAMDAQGLLDDRHRYRAVGSTFRAVCEPFNVERIAAPWADDPGLNFWRKSYGWAKGTPSQNVSIESLVDQSEQHEAAGIVLLAFDTTRAFDEQIEAIRHHFEARQKDRHGAVLRPQRQHKRKWSTYLRAIDARDQEATYADLYLELELAALPPADYDAALDGNLAASGLQLHRQAVDLMFKVTS